MREVAFLVLSSHQGFQGLVMCECSTVRGKKWFPLLLVARKRFCSALLCHRGKFCQFSSITVAYQIVVMLCILCLVRSIHLLHILVRMKSQVRPYFCKCLGLSSTFCTVSFFAYLSALEYCIKS